MAPTQNKCISMEAAPADLCLEPTAINISKIVSFLKNMGHVSALYIRNRALGCSKLRRFMLDGTMERYRNGIVPLQYRTFCIKERYSIGTILFQYRSFLFLYQYRRSLGCSRSGTNAQLLSPSHQVRLFGKDLARQDFSKGKDCVSFI